MSNKTKHLRGSKQPQPKQRAQQNRSVASISRADVPAAYGFSVRSTAPRVVRSGSGATIVGSDYAGSVYSNNSSSYEPAATVPLNPSYFTGAMLGSLSRAFEKYRFKRAVIEYIPSVPTSTQGQLVFLSDRSIKNPFLDGGASSFLSRALSQSNAVACPLWQRTTFNCECNSAWSLVDPLIDGDLDDSISLEVQLYSFGTSTLTAGILMLHYEIEFRDPLYTFHSTVLPISVGVGFTTIGNDDTGVNAVNEAVKLNMTSSLLATYGRGAIFRLIFITAGSVTPTGIASWNLAAAVTTSSAVTSTTFASAVDAISMASGTTLYGLLYGANSLVLYNSYESAAGEHTGGAVVYQTATTAGGSWKFLGQAVRMGNTLLVTAQ